MATRRISSQTQEYPAPGDVFRALLSRMVEWDNESAWAHFEIIAEGGWFENLLFRKEAWIEIAFENRQSLLLSARIPKPKRPLMPGIPVKWLQKRKGLWTVPAADIEELISWADNCLAAVSGKPDYRVSGWIEG
jgi:hypothetical protein